MVRTYLAVLATIISLSGFAQDSNSWQHGFGSNAFVSYSTLTDTYHSFDYTAKYKKWMFQAGPVFGSRNYTNVGIGIQRFRKTLELKGFHISTQFTPFSKRHKTHFILTHDLFLLQFQRGGNFRTRRNYWEL